MNKELQDKAWAVLPKEFKEEVKKRYLVSASISDSLKYQYEKGIMKNQYDLGVTNTYKNIFGEHNLTSDTETEEMLIVSRKAAEEFCDKYFGKRLCEVNRSSMRKDINALFGGKCRVGEDEPKFNVGDKVIVSFEDGRRIVGYIYEVMQNGAYDVDFGDGCMAHNVKSERIAPYTEPKQENTGNENNLRLQVATAIMQGLFNATSVERFTVSIMPPAIAKAAVEYADALIKEINGKGGGDERNNN